MPTVLIYNNVGFNTGNLAFHYALARILGGRQETFQWHSEPEKLNALEKIGVIPCANQLGSHVDYGGLAERFKFLKIPLIAVGLGAQGSPNYDQALEVPIGTQAWIKQIARCSKAGQPNIGVRGPYTLNVLKQYGLEKAAVVTGCPTLFLNPDPRLGKCIEARAQKPLGRVAVAAGHQKWKHLSKLERSLVTMMERSAGSYIVQSPIEMVALARGEANIMSEDDLTECCNYACPQLTNEEFKIWARMYCRVYFNVSEWMEYLRGHDFVIGTRIHGVVLGIQAGIPGLCIAHDSRTRELCEVMHVPFIMASEVMNGLTIEEAMSRYKFDGETFDQNRRVLASRLSDLLQTNGAECSPWLAGLYNAGS